MEYIRPAMWHDHDIDFARWLHPAMWHVALESWQCIHQVAAPGIVILGSGMTHAIEFAQTSAILDFYVWFRFRPHHRSRHVLLHQCPKFYPNRTTIHRKKMTSWWFSRWRISAILDFRHQIMGSLRSPCTTSYRSSIETIALNCLVFEKIAFFWLFGDRQTFLYGIMTRPSLSDSKSAEHHLNFQLVCRSRVH